MKGVLIKYIMTYVIPIPIYLYSLFLIGGLNGELIQKYRISEIIVCLLATIELVIIVSLFNFLGYKSSLKYIEKDKAKKIYKLLIVINFIISSILIFFIC